MTYRKANNVTLQIAQIAADLNLVCLDPQSEQLLPSPIIQL
jgi:hypothetical protein